MYEESYLSRSEAMHKEYVIKKWKSRKLIEELINGLKNNWMNAAGPPDESGRLSLNQPP